MCLCLIVGRMGFLMHRTPSRKIRRHVGLRLFGQNAALVGRCIGTGLCKPIANKGGGKDAAIPICLLLVSRRAALERYAPSSSLRPPGRLSSETCRSNGLRTLGAA